MNATLTELAASRQVAAFDIHPNLAGAEFSNYDGQELDFSDEGVRVDTVEPGSPAAQRGLRADDIIVTVNRSRVRSVSELSEVAEGQNLLILGLRRGQRDLLLQIR